VTFFARVQALQISTDILPPSLGYGRCDGLKNFLKLFRCENSVKYLKCDDLPDSFILWFGLEASSGLNCKNRPMHMEICTSSQIYSAFF